MALSSSPLESSSSKAPGSVEAHQEPPMGDFILSGLQFSCTNIQASAHSCLISQRGRLMRFRTLEISPAEKVSSSQVSKSQDPTCGMYEGSHVVVEGAASGFSEWSLSMRSKRPSRTPAYVVTIRQRAPFYKAHNSLRSPAWILHFLPIYVQHEGVCSQI